MDTTAPILYYASVTPVELNSGYVDTANRLAGSIVEIVRWGGLDVVQFAEKRALSDGMDVGDPYLGSARVELSGMLYGRTHGELFDQLQALRAACNPAIAFRSDPSAHGYRPLYYYQPTESASDYPETFGTDYEGRIPLKLLAMPRGLQHGELRRRQGGRARADIQRTGVVPLADIEAPLAMPWSCSWVMRDPRAYSQDPVTKWIDTFADGDMSGNFVNRGDFHAPLNMLWNVNAGAGTITLTGGGSILKITVPASTGNRIIRYSGENKILTVEEGGVESLRMSWMTFLQQTTHPEVPGGTSAYSVAYVVTSGGFALVGTEAAATGSRIWFDEAYAL